MSLGGVRTPPVAKDRLVPGPSGERCGRLKRDSIRLWCFAIPPEAAARQIETWAYYFARECVAAVNGLRRATGDLS
jgi:hypothetical protein